MLNKPKFMCPSTSNGYVIDTNNEFNYFSCIVDGNEAINQYNVKIYDITNNTLLADITRGQGGVPDGEVFNANGLFYPINENNENNILKIKINKDTFASSNVVNREQAYYWVVTVQGTSGTKAVSNEAIFYANSTPQVVILFSSNNQSFNPLDVSGSSVLASRKYYFKATYTQNENINLKKYGWKLIDTQSNQVLIDTISNNNIYGTNSNIECKYFGFLNNCKYSIQLYVETQNGQMVLTTPIEFSVKYKTAIITSNFKVDVLKKEPAILLDWDDTNVIAGKVLGDNISYISNYPNPNINSNTVHISKGSSILYDYEANTDLDISEDCYIVLSTQFTSLQNKIIFQASGIDEQGQDITRQLSFVSDSSGNSLNYIVAKGNHQSQVNYLFKDFAIDDMSWFIIIMHPLINSGSTYSTELTVNKFRAENGLLPNDTLYPSESLNPSLGTWVRK